MLLLKRASKHWAGPRPLAKQKKSITVVVKTEGACVNATLAVMSIAVMAAQLAFVAKANAPAPDNAPQHKACNKGRMRYLLSLAGEKKAGTLFGS